MPTAYSNRQIEAANLLKDVSPDVVDEIMAMVGEAEKTKLNEKIGDTQEQTETAIKIQLLYETDWRKRAALSALLISKSLE